MNKSMRWWTLALLACLLALLPVLAGAESGESGKVQVCAFFDSNRNGERGAFERALPDVQVELLSGDTVTATAVTDKNGNAVFADVPAGDYKVRTTLPGAWGYTKIGAKKAKVDPANISVMDQSADAVQTSGKITVKAGETTGVGIGAMQLVSVGGRVWIDENDDGVMQDSEPGYQGLTLTITGTKNKTKVTVVSDENGCYAAQRLLPGTYEISATAPSGMTYAKYVKVGGTRRSIFSSEGNATRTKSLPLTDGVADLDENIGLLPGSTVQGVCFLDANYNGFYDEGEPLLSGVKIEVIRQNKDTVSGKAVSAKDGAFAVSGLRASTYKIRAILPEGMFFTMIPGSAEGNRFKAMTGRREFSLTDVQLGVGKELTLAIGAVKPASVSGVAYEDDDFSGTKNGKEKVVSGLTVSLLDASGKVVAADNTNVKGKYEFTGLVPGEYTVSLSAKSGYAFTKVGTGNVIHNLSGGKGASDAFSLTLGENRTGMDCGMILPGIVQGELFADANDNGVQDSGETGLTGAVVKLMDESGEVFSAVIGADGRFCFDAVMPGTYQVAYQLPEDAVFAKAPANAALQQTAANAAASDWFKFAMADTVDMPVCGALTLGHVTGTVFHDGNVNGVQDGDETPASGVVITMTPSDPDNETVSVTTGEDGVYAIIGLRPDTYQLTMQFAEGQVLSSSEYLSLPVCAGSRGGAVTVEIPMGTALDHQELGVVTGASVSGCVWMDANNNGLMEEDEPGISGQTVVVTNDATGAVFAELVTDELGSFRTDDIAMVPGVYTLTYALDENSTAAPAGDTNFAVEEGMLILRGLTLGEGEERTGLLAGVVRYTQVGGKVWVDRGGMVERLAGAELTLTDAEGQLLAETVTDEQGQYVFGGLLPGQYALHATLPAGQVVVEPTDARLSGARVSVITDCDGRSGKSDVFDVMMAQDRLNMDVGGVLPARVGDLVWLDVNGNGLQDSSEHGVPNVKVSLLRGGEVTAETVTDQYGFYYFGDVYPAVYTLRVELPDNTQPTVIRTDFAGVGSILTESGETTEFSVASGKRFYNADMGLACLVPGAYPEGYGQGATQNWTKLGSAN